MEAKAGIWRKQPALLPLLCVALGFWTGSACAYLYSFPLKQEEIGFFILLTMVPLAGTAIASFKARSSLLQHLAFILLGLALGTACGLLASLSSKARIESIEAEGFRELRFEIVEDLKGGTFAPTAIAQTRLANGQKVQVRIVFKTQGLDVGFGDIITARTQIKPHGTYSAEFYWQQGIEGTAEIRSFEKQARSDLFGFIVAVRNSGLAILDNYSGQGQALLRAILVGERSHLDLEGIYGGIKVVGLAHLVAVSGSHLVIVAGFLATLLRFFRTRRSIALLVQILFVLAYLILTGMQVSAIRAGLMSSIVLSSFFVKRRASSMNALSLCIIAVVALNPISAVSLSFLLSASSTLSIIVLSGLCDNWCRAAIRKLPTLVRDSLSLTLAANIAVMPIAAAFFSQVSLVSPLANVFAVPVFALLCTGGLIALFLSLFIPALTALLIPPFLVLSQGFCDLVGIIAAIPFAAIPANLEPALAISLSFVLFGLLWYFWPRPSRARAFLLISSLGLVCACLIFVFPLFKHDEIIMLDVGQGDAFIVRSQNRSMLIDTGNHNGELLAGLARHGIFVLDTLVISHPDSDHCGSLSALRGVVQVRSVCVAADMLSCGCESCEALLAEATKLVGAENIRPLGLGDSIVVGNFRALVIWPESFSERGGNADSLSLLVVRQGKAQWKALFLGDLEAKQLGTILALDLVGDIDILKVGHHAARVSLDRESATKLSPEIALISVGANNRYGHPSAEALALLEGLHCEVFRSDEVGDVVCKFTDEKISLVTLR